MTGPEALFINAEMFYDFGVPTLHTTVDSAAHDVINGMPTQPQQFCDSLRVGTVLQKLTTNPRTSGESRMLVRPWGTEGLDSALGAVGTGKSGNKDGFKLHGIQMTPFLLGSVVIYATGFTTFRALNVLSDIDKSDDYLQACHGQVDILNLPG